LRSQVVRNELSARFKYTKARIRLEIGIEIRLDFDQSKQNH